MVLRWLVIVKTNCYDAEGTFISKNKGFTAMMLLTSVRDIVNHMGLRTVAGTSVNFLIA